MAEAQSQSQSPRELPREIILYNILPRVPAKSLLRFMCVSKGWHTLLKTPSFQKLHLHHVTNDQDSDHHKLLVFSEETPHLFNTIDCEAPEDGLTASRPFPFEATSEYITILTSFDGLVCVGITKFRHDLGYSDLILWNPLTGDYKTLSKANSHKDIYYCYDLHREGGAFGLYYSSCEDDYKLVCVSRHIDAYIYSLKSDAWRKVDSLKYLKSFDNWFLEAWWPSTPLNEKLYFLNYTVTNDDPQQEDLSAERISYSIIRFDTKTEKFTDISIDPFSRVRCLNSHGGCIHLYVIHGNYGWVDRVGDVKLWRIDEDEDGDGEWKEVVTYTNTNSFCEYPLHLMRDGNWLTHSRSTSQGSSVYNIDLAPHFKNISFNDHGMDIHIPTNGKYIETLVSPNRYL